MALTSSVSRRTYTTQEEREQETRQRFAVAKESKSYNNKLSEFLAQPNTKKFTGNLISRNFSGGRKNCFESPQVLENEINDYFALCGECEMIPTISSLVLYLGVSKDRLYDYVNQPQSPFHDISLQAVNTCHSINELGALTSTVNSNLYTFLAKNYYNMHDSSEVVLSPKNDATINNSNTMTIIQEQLETERVEQIKADSERVKLLQ